MPIHDKLRVDQNFVNPFYNEEAGRRTGWEQKKEARKDSDGFEIFDDYWSDSDQSAMSVDIVIAGKENKSKTRKKGQTIKDATPHIRKLSSPLKPMSSFSSVQSSTGPTKDTVLTEAGEHDATSKTIHGGDLDGSISIVNASNVPNSALQNFKTKKRLTFSAAESIGKDEVNCEVESNYYQTEPIVKDPRTADEQSDDQHSLDKTLVPEDVHKLDSPEKNMQEKQSTTSASPDCKDTEKIEPNQVRDVIRERDPVIGTSKTDTSLLPKTTDIDNMESNFLSFKSKSVDVMANDDDDDDYDDDFEIIEVNSNIFTQCQESPRTGSKSKGQLRSQRKRKPMVISLHDSSSQSKMYTESESTCTQRSGMRSRLSRSKVESLVESSGSEKGNTTRTRTGKGRKAKIPKGHKESDTSVADIQTVTKGRGRRRSKEQDIDADDSGSRYVGDDAKSRHSDDILSIKKTGTRTTRRTKHVDKEPAKPVKSKESVKQLSSDEEAKTLATDTRNESRTGHIDTPTVKTLPAKSLSKRNKARSEQFVQSEFGCRTSSRSNKTVRSKLTDVTLADNNQSSEDATSESDAMTHQRSKKPQQAFVHSNNNPATKTQSKALTEVKKAVRKNHRKSAVHFSFGEATNVSLAKGLLKPRKSILNIRDPNSRWQKGSDEDDEDFPFHITKSSGLYNTGCQENDGIVAAEESEEPPENVIAHTPTSRYSAKLLHAIQTHTKGMHTKKRSCTQLQETGADVEMDVSPAKIVKRSSRQSRCHTLPNKRASAPSSSSSLMRQNSSDDVEMVASATSGRRRRRPRGTHGKSIGICDQTDVLAHSQFGEEIDHIPTPSRMQNDHFPIPSRIPNKATSSSSSSSSVKSNTSPIASKRKNGKHLSNLTIRYFEVPRKKAFIIDPETIDDGTRKTKRHRVKPLEFWRNERAIYKRRASGGFALSGIQSPTLPTPSPPNEKVKRRAKKIPVTPHNLSIHTSVSEDDFEHLENPTLTVINPSTNEEVDIDAVKTSKMNHYFGPTGDPATSNDHIAMSKCLHQRAFSAGELLVRPFQEKGLQYVCHDTMVFRIIRGKLAVTIHQTTTILESGDVFFVPQGNMYNLKNLRNDEAKLFFVQVKGRV